MNLSLLTLLFAALACVCAHEIPADRAAVRFVNAVENGPKLKLYSYIHDDLFKNVKYGDYTKYKEIKSGKHEMDVREQGTTVPLPGTKFLWDFAEGHAYTIVASGNKDKLILANFGDNVNIKDPEAPFSEQSWVRFVNMIEESNKLLLSDPDIGKKGKHWFPELSYEELSVYCLATDSWNFTLFDKNDNVVLRPPPGGLNFTNPYTDGEIATVTVMAIGTMDNPKWLGDNGVLVSESYLWPAGWDYKPEKVCHYYANDATSVMTSVSRTTVVHVAALTLAIGLLF